MDAIYVERLTKLRDYLKALVLPEHGTFAMHIWMRMEEDGCGWAGCAIGWGAPLFEAEGFTLKPFHFLGCQCHMCAEKRHLFPHYEGQEGFDAVALFFGLSEDVALSLFDPDCYEEPPQPREVAERITQVLETGCA